MNIRKIIEARSKNNKQIKKKDNMLMKDSKNIENKFSFFLNL